MELNPRFAIGATIYVKQVGGVPRVTKGTVHKSTTEVWARDFRGHATNHKIVYVVTVCDRDNFSGFVHMTAPEDMCFDSWDNAWIQCRD